MESVESAQEKIAAVLPRLPAEEVALGDAAGRYLSSPLKAARAVPSFTCSAMDGWAVRAAEVPGPVRLRAGRTLYAGDPGGLELGLGEAARIFTGAPLPPGADAVVPQELARQVGAEVELPSRVEPFECVRRAGEDVEVGAVALPAGTRLGPRQIGLCASLGTSRLPVVARPRAFVLSTGDEIASGQVPDSNARTLAGALAALGARVEVRRVRDDAEALAGALEEALGAADAVLTTGGASAGERDLVPAAMARVGAAIVLRGVAMAPGRTFLFAERGGAPLFALPGSPSACLVAFEVFARPALRAMAGAVDGRRRALRLPLAEALEGRPGRARFEWARIGPGGRAQPLGRGAAQLRGPAIAELLIALPPEAGSLPRDAPVDCWLLEEAAP